MMDHECRHGPRPNKKLEFSDQGRVFCDFRYAPFAATQRRKRMQVIRDTYCMPSCHTQPHRPFLGTR